MNVREAIKSVRDDYAEQFDAMVAHQRAKRSDVHLERRMQRPESNLFGKIYVPDISFGDPMTEWLDLVPRERAGALPSFFLNTPNLVVEFEDLWWDDVRLDHDGEFTGQLVSWWFNRWMSPADPSTPTPRAEGLSGFIHSVTVDEKWICIDLGTATVDALFNILSVAQNCGAKTGRVTSSRSRA
ncbi:hypothetical protein GCM10022276_12140 [Sphingomonas limnosediminicola]|uniref:Uncharacterized protein n=2 Tax=Sphingomonas limnosediminicola TaxID=940133 RepID=A0ABP7L7H6_9SPHN